MTDTVLNAFLVHGPLGLIALLATLVAVKLYRDLQAERLKRDEERLALEQRYITKVESFIEKNHELVKSSVALADAMQRRIDRRRGE